MVDLDVVPDETRVIQARAAVEAAREALLEAQAQLEMATATIA